MSRKNRHKVRGLTSALRAARRERDQLKHDIRKLVEYADEETQRLQSQNEQLKQEQKEFQLRILDLKKQLDALTCFASAHTLSGCNIGLSLSEDAKLGKTTWNDNVDLSTVNVALVGGRPHVRQAVLQELCIGYRLRQWVEVSPFECAATRRSRLRSKLYRCDLIVIITGYMTHPLTELVYNLKNSGALSGKVVLLNCQGKTGVVREILHFVKELRVGF